MILETLTGPSQRYLLIFTLSSFLPTFTSAPLQHDAIGESLYTPELATLTAACETRPTDRRFFPWANPTLPIVVDRGR